MVSVLCEHCTAECCRYLALPLDLPETKRDFDDIRWYLMHGGVLVFVEEGNWFIQVRTTCNNLQSDFKCGVYETRPEICREYKAHDCDYTGGDYGYDLLFTQPEQIVAYAKEYFAKKRKKKVASKSGAKATMKQKAAARKRVKPGKGPARSSGKRRKAS